MTPTNAKLAAAQDALAALEEALADLETRRAFIHPDRFALMAEPIVAGIPRMRSEVNDLTKQPSGAKSQRD